MKIIDLDVGRFDSSIRLKDTEAQTIRETHFNMGDGDTSFRTIVDYAFVLAGEQEVDEIHIDGAGVGSMVADYMTTLARRLDVKSKILVFQRTVHNA